MNYISYDEWMNKVAHPQDGVCRNQFIHQHESEKFAIASRFKPSRIAEIGVRLGYSAHAFLSAAGPDATYTGHDVVNGGHGGTNIAGLEYAEAILRRDFPTAGITLVKVNTQTVMDLGLTDFDFFHVDGDHTTAGALHDMVLAWEVIRSGGVMLVDDYDHLVEVRVAVDKFTVDFASQYQSREYIKTFRGDVLFVKK